MPKKISLSLVLALQLAIHTFAIVSLVGYLSYRSGQQAVEDLAGQLMKETGDRVEANLDSFFSRIESVAENNAALVEENLIDIYDLQALQDHFVRQIHIFPLLDAIALSNEEGDFIAAERLDPTSLEIRRLDRSSSSQFYRYYADENGQNLELQDSGLGYDPHNDPPGHPWYGRAREAKEGVWSLVVTLAKGYEQPEIHAIYLLPLYNDRGQFQGVMATGSYLVKTGEFLASLNVSPNGQVFLIDRQGHLIATSTGEVPFPGKPRRSRAKHLNVEPRHLPATESQNPLTRATAKYLFGGEFALDRLNQPQVFEFSFNSERHYARVVPLQGELDWLAVTVVPESDFLSQIQGNVRHTVVLCVLALLGAIGMGWWTSRWITGSLSRLTRATQDFKEGKPLQPFETTPICEVAALSQSFAEMVDSVHQADQLRQNYQQDLERQVAEKTAALQERTAQLQAAQRIAHVGSWELNIATGQTTWSPELGRICGYDEEHSQSINPDLLDLVHPQERHILARAVEMAIAHGLPYQVEHRIVRPDGTTRFLLSRGEVVFNSQGQPVKLAGTATDITDRRQAELALKHSEARLQAITDSVYGCICYVDSGQRYRFVNRTYEDWFGHSKEAILGRTVKEVIGIRAYNRARPYLERVLSGATVIYENELPARGGQTRYVSVVLVPDIDAEGGVEGYYAPIGDISNLKRAEAAMRRQLAAMEAAIDGIAILQGDSFIYVNQAHLRLFGYQRPEDLVGRSWRSLYAPAQIERFEGEILPALEGKGSWQGEAIAQRADGSTFYEELSLTLCEDGLTIRVCRDISDLKRAREQILHQALHDPLTGLANRTLLTQRLEGAIASAKGQQNYCYGVFFIDLDRFKVINDSLGHLVGDQLLIWIAHRLETHSGNENLVARLGSDEFIILIEDLANTEQAIEVAEGILREFETPFLICGQEIFTSLSIGIVLATQDYHRAGDLIRDADIAMYRAKQQRSNSYQLFDPSMYVQAIERHTLETQLRQALEREEFVLFYQPIFELPEERLVGFEALVRWQHPTRGLISPAEFIPIAEETGLIVPLDALVFEQACRQMASWKNRFANCASLKMNINLSVRDLHQNHLIKEIDRLLRVTGLGGDSLILEITESLLMDDLQGTIALLARIKSRNIQIAVDDFGTGYSCLGYLHRFPVDNLKIDRSFISEIQSDVSQYYVVDTIITLGQKLGLSITAEGIETGEQLARLQQLGCQFGQGYLFSKPLPATEIESLYLARM